MDNNDIEIINNLLENSKNLIVDELNFYKYCRLNLSEKASVELNGVKGDKPLFKAILTIYATYEFSVKETLSNVLEIIDKEKIDLKMINKKISILYFQKNIDEFRINLTKNHIKEEILAKKISSIYDVLNDNRKFEFTQNMIDTKSNLNFKVLENLLYYFDIENNMIKEFKPYIESLVHYRNNIAHGNIDFFNSIPPRMLPINNENLEKLCEYILQLFDFLNKEVLSYLTEKKYLQ